jgi:hypothetical protein
MAEPCLPGTNSFDRSDRARVGDLASGQFGRVTAAQLRILRISKQTAWYWTTSGYLYPELPAVYAVGHPGRSEESDLFAAVLYAGPDAALRNLTAGLWRGLVKWETASGIEVSTPRRCRSLPAGHPENGLGKEIDVRDRRPPERDPWNGVPTIPIPEIVLELAAGGDLELVRFVLAQMDFLRILRERELEAVCRRGVPGSAVLRQAIDHPQPLFAKARSKFEVRLIHVCELTNIPLPEVNAKVGGVRPDAMWRDEMVIVECDGQANHDTWRQRKSDAKKELILRGLGFQVIRYVYEQLDNPWAIHNDLLPILAERRGRGARAAG